MARPNIIIDSNIVIDVLLEEQNALDWLQSQRGQTIGIVSITAMEVIRGAHNKRQLDKIRRELSRFEMLHLLRQDSDWALTQFSAFWLSHQIGINDCLIGAIAARLNIPFYTRNIRDFEPLPDVNALMPYST